MCKLNLIRSLEPLPMEMKTLHLAVHTPSGTAALSSYYTNDVVVVDLASGKVVQKYLRLAENVLALFYAADDLWCITNNYQELTAYLVNMHSGERRKLLTGKNFAGAACAYPHRVALSWIHQIIVLDLENLDIVGCLEDYEDCTDLSLDKEGRLLAFANPYGVMQLYDVDKLERLRSFDVTEPSDIALSPAGDLLAVKKAPRRIDLWCLNTGCHTSITTDPDYVVGAICFDEESQLLYTGDWQHGKLLIWEVQREHPHIAQ